MVALVIKPAPLGWPGYAGGKSMRRLAAMTLTLALVPGCFNYRSSQVCAFVGGSAVAVGGAVAIFGDSGGSGDLISPRDAAAIFVVIPGALIALAGLAGMALHDSPAEEARQQEAADRVQQRPPPPAVNADREQAWSLTKAARAAARAGDCARVRALDGEVLALDPEFHATVFLRDVATKGCLDAAAPAPVTTPAPPVTPLDATP